MEDRRKYYIGVYGEYERQFAQQEKERMDQIQVLMSCFSVPSLALLLDETLGQSRTA